MRIALLVPSRERIRQKQDLLKSVLNTVSDINNVTLYFGIDDNDPTKSEIVKMVQEQPFVKIVEIHNEGKFLGLGKLWNICAKASNEEIISMIGDDMVFISKDWDTKILEEYSPSNCPKDNIKMVYCNDGRHGSKISVNAFVHRRYMDITGYFMREEFRVDFIDIWLQQVFKALGRIKYRGDIHIEHRHWSFGKMPMDGVAHNLRGNGYPEVSRSTWINTKNERIKEAEKIAKAIGVCADLTKINDGVPG